MADVSVKWAQMGEFIGKIESPADLTAKYLDGVATKIKEIKEDPEVTRADLAIKKSFQALTKSFMNVNAALKKEPEPPGLRRGAADPERHNQAAMHAQENQRLIKFYEETGLKTLAPLVSDYEAKLESKNSAIQSKIMGVLEQMGKQGGGYRKPKSKKRKAPKKRKATKKRKSTKKRKTSRKRR